MKKDDAVKFFGNKVKLASVVGLTPASITGWGENIPVAWAYRLEVITNGKLKANDSWLTAKLNNEKAA